MWIRYIFSPSNKCLKRNELNLIDFRYQRHTLAVVGENLKCKKLSKRLQFLAVQTRCLSHAPNSATILIHILRVSVHRGRKLWVNTRAVTFFQINNGRTGAIQQCSTGIKSLKNAINLRLQNAFKNIPEKHKGVVHSFSINSESVRYTKSHIRCYKKSSLIHTRWHAQ